MSANLKLLYAIAKTKLKDTEENRNYYREMMKDDDDNHNELMYEYYDGKLDAFEQIVDLLDEVLK